MLILWIVRASHSRQVECTHFYARDEQHAREQAKSWQEERRALFSSFEFHACPRGYMAGAFTWLPGQLEEIPNVPQ